MTATATLHISAQKTPAITRADIGRTFIWHGDYITDTDDGTPTTITGTLAWVSETDGWCGIIPDWTHSSPQGATTYTVSISGLHRIVIRTPQRLTRAD
jgi:hypothetical protein